MTDTPSPLDPDTPPVDDADLETWVERSIYDTAQAERYGGPGTEAQTVDHPLHGWRPADDGQAEWAMSKLAALEGERRRIDADHDEWAAKVERSRADALRTLLHRIRFFTEALRGYALAWHDQAPDVRTTLHLPSGTVPTRTPRSPTVKILDAGRADLVTWLQGLDDKTVDEAKALKVTDPEPMISGVRKLVKAVPDGDGWRVVDPATGEVVPGLVALPPGPTTAEPKPNLS